MASFLHTGPSQRSLRRRLDAAPKIAKYAVGAAPALATSVVVFAVLDSFRIRSGIDCVAAFAAGALPNWLLNREWAWKINTWTERMREMAGYAVIAVLVWAASTWATGHTQNWATAHVSAGDGHRVILTTAAYVIVQAIFFPIKFQFFETWVFPPPSRTAS